MTQSPERAGWYDDPEDPEQLRYFDGIVWSQRVVPKRAPVRQPEPTPSPAPGHVDPTPVGFPRQPAPQSPWQDGPRTAPGAGGVASDGRPLAGFGLRLASGLIDLLVVWAIGVVTAGWAFWLWMADYVAFAVDNVGDPDAVQRLDPDDLVAFFDWRWFTIAIGLMALTAWFYHVLMLTRRGGTVGKLATGTTVRVVGQPVGPLPASAAIRRTSLVVLLWLLCSVPLISWFAVPALVVDHVWAARDPQRQTVHDKLAGTEVVQR